LAAPGRTEKEIRKLCQSQQWLLSPLFCTLELTASAPAQEDTARRKLLVVTAVPKDTRESWRRKGRRLEDLCLVKSSSAASPAPQPCLTL